MASGYRISRTAERQIAEIIDYTDLTFGSLQTEAYITGLTQSLELLAEFPGIGVAAFEIKEGWRRYRYRSHYVFSSTNPD